HRHPQASAKRPQPCWFRKSLTSGHYFLALRMMRMRRMSCARQLAGKFAATGIWLPPCEHWADRQIALGENHLGGWQRDYRLRGRDIADRDCLDRQPP